MSDIFTAPDQEQEQKQTPTQEPNELDTILASIVNDKGEPKYKNHSEALKALKHSQEFIPHLRQEKEQSDKKLQELEEQINGFKGLEEVVHKLTQKQAEPDTKGKQFDEEAIKQLINSTLTAKQQETVAKQNISATVKALQNKFGEKASQVFYAQGEELGLSAEEMNALAAKSPGAVLRMFGMNGSDAHKQSTQAPSQTKINTQALPTNQRQSMIGRETELPKLGSTHRDMMAQMERARAMLEELNESGVTVDDLTDPKNYFKLFNK